MRDKLSKEKNMRDKLSKENQWIDYIIDVFHGLGLNADEESAYVVLHSDCFAYFFNSFENPFKISKDNIEEYLKFGEKKIETYKYHDWPSEEDAWVEFLDRELLIMLRTPMSMTQVLHHAVLGFDEDYIKELTKRSITKEQVKKYQTALIKQIGVISDAEIFWEFCFKAIVRIRDEQIAMPKKAKEARRKKRKREKKQVRDMAKDLLNKIVSNSMERSENHKMVKDLLGEVVDDAVDISEKEARLKAEEEARLKAEEEARKKDEEEARKKAEEEARLKAEKRKDNKILSEIFKKLGQNLQNYLCPISMDVIVDPVVASDGRTYERSYITKHLQKTSAKSPITNEVLDPKLYFNRFYYEVVTEKLKQFIREAETELKEST